MAFERLEPRRQQQRVHHQNLRFPSALITVALATAIAGCPKSGDDRPSVGPRDAGPSVPLRDGGPIVVGPVDRGPFDLIAETNFGIPGMYLGGIAAADYDHDGDNDVVMFGYWDTGHADGINCSGSLEGRYYENVSEMGGAIRFQLAHTWPNQGICSASVLGGDLNGDGHQDFVVQISVDVDTVAYMGRGDGTFEPQSIEQNFGVHSNSMGMAIADFDRNGVDDIVFNADGYAESFNGAGSALWYTWNGTGFDRRQDDYSHQIVYGGAIAAGDLTGDGFPEIVVGGNGSVPFGNYYCDNVLYGQIHENESGLISKEMFAVVPNFSLRNYGRSSTTTAPNPQRFSNDCNGGDNVQYWIADLDLDGTQDIVSAGSGGFSGRVGSDYPGNAHYTVAFLLNVDGSGSNYVTWENVHFGPGGRPGHLDGDFTNSGIGNTDLPSIAVGDLNGDGWPEVVVQGHRRWLEDRFSEYIFGNMLFRNLGHGDFEWEVDGLPIPNGVAECGNVIVDLNRDGKNDLIICGAERPWHTNGSNLEDRNDASSIKTYIFRQP